ncbi:MULTISPECIES: ribbon-helix-helix protein, CopG family [Megasphaera]|uniref:HicB family protein n=1 Tax=Megasphaera vaginalis (ex Srinivasan et al. 2021) TaxID=1111454 RepID=U7UK15_9FIRM|nr:MULTISPECIES: ribbon-helix-helix protein, CopG family [Megasphaera]ERT59660.1 HicB family protein [Megasphaera vaginalis (ex Srinivasan et al. 2021)]
MEDKEKEPCGNRVRMTGKKQITLRLPDELYEALRAEAKKTGISVNELILIKINPLEANFLDHEP